MQDSQYGLVELSRYMSLATLTLADDPIAAKLLKARSTPRWLLRNLPRPPPTMSSNFASRSLNIVNHNSAPLSAGGCFRLAPLPI